MIEAFKEAYAELNQLVNGHLLQLVMIPVSLSVMTLIFKTVKCVCHGEYTYIHTEQSQGEPIRNEPTKVNLSKSEIDNDLGKYFDYSVNL